jgi:hypothetical protein
VGGAATVTSHGASGGCFDGIQIKVGDTLWQCIRNGDNFDFHATKDGCASSYAGSVEAYKVNLRSLAQAMSGSGILPKAVPAALYVVWFESLNRLNHGT